MPDDTRDPTTGELIHDDHLVAAALVAELDDQEWTIYRGGGSVTTRTEPRERETF